MLNRILFTGQVARIVNGSYVVVIGDTTHTYNMLYYRPLIDLEPESTSV